MQKSKICKSVLILILISFAFLMLGNGLMALTNPDEVFYSQTAKEMIQQKTWSVPYLFGQPQLEKPILTYWLLRFAYMLFGVNSFGARFFPALFGIIGVIAVYFLALLAFKDELKAFFCGLILASAGLYIGLSRTVFTDLIFSVFILLSLAAFFWGYLYKESKGAGLTLFFAFSGLAVLTKGPLGIILPLFSVLLYLSLKKELRFLFCWACVLGGAVFLLISVPWYAEMILKFKKVFIREFFINDHLRRVLEAEHRSADRWYFYPGNMIFGMFPWSLYTAAAIIYSFKKSFDRRSPEVYLYLASWILAVFLVFQAAHSKLSSYIFPLFPALALVSGDYLVTAVRAGRHRLIGVFSWITWAIFFSFPAGICFGVIKYPQYLLVKFAPYFILAFILLQGLMLHLILKKRYLANAFVTAFIIPLLLWFALISHKNFDPYVSSKEACEFLTGNYRVQGKILCSKAFVRGIRFYTDKDVAVTNVGGADFFSPHPIPVMHTDLEVQGFLKRQPLTFCIVNKSSYEDLRRISSDSSFSLELLSTIGNEYILTVKTR